jgi:hypothetical protein
MANYENQPSIEPKGIAGWLLLPFLGTIMAAFDNIYSALLIFRAFENSPVHQSVNGLLVAELITSIALFIGFVIAIIFALRHKRLYPKLFIYLIVITLIVNFIDIYFSVVDFGIPFEPDDVKGLMKPIMTFLIWGPYMYRSKRVKNTFTK